jgi:hypothetical protein
MHFFANVTDHLWVDGLPFPESCQVNLIASLVLTLRKLELFKRPGGKLSDTKLNLLCGED